jgi:hypothetical protein
MAFDVTAHVRNAWRFIAGRSPYTQGINLVLLPLRERLEAPN